MDRFDAMGIFVAVVDRGGFAPAARHLDKSPAAVTRAIAFLEEHAGAQLLTRTTRITRLTEAGDRYLASCRRILAAVAEADELAEEREPRGLLTISAPVLFGRLHVRPIVTKYLRAWPAAQVRLSLVDRMVNLADEGVDIALRIGHLADSALRAIKLGHVERVTCASPAYLARKKAPRTPADLREHDCIGDSWPFRKTQVRVTPRLHINGAEAAIASALDGLGITCVLSYQVERELREGRLVRLLAKWQRDPLPVQLVHPPSHLPPPKVRAFLDLAVPMLRAALRV